MGRMLREIREAQDTNRVKDREEALSLTKQLSRFPFLKGANAE